MTCLSMSPAASRLPGSNRRSTTSLLSTAPSTNSFTSSSTRFGWTGGAGVEYALANGWSVNGELLYMQFKKESDTFASPTFQQ